MHTNSTTYYNLPQFVGTDIVNDLTDTNGAYSAIDSAIHDVASSIGEDSAKIAALEAQNGDYVLTTTAQTLTGAVNELDDDLNNATTGAFALISGNTADIAGIENTIGDANSGMIKDIGQLQTTVGAQGLSIGSLQTTVGDADSGLVKSVNDLGAEDVIIEQSISDLQGSVVRIDGKVGSASLDTTAQDLSGAVNELNTAIGAITVPTAAEVSYNNTTSGLTADDVQEAIDEIVGTEATILASVQGDGTKTRGALLAELYAAVASSVPDYETFCNTRFVTYISGEESYAVAEPSQFTSTSLVYLNFFANTTALSCSETILKASSAQWISIDMQTSGNTITDTSSNIVQNTRHYYIVKV